MKKTIIVLSAILLQTFSASAQTKVKEVGIGLSNLNVFNTNAYSLNYRWGKGDKLFTISGGLNLASNFDKKNNNTDNYNDTLVSIFSNNSIQESPYNIGLNVNINTIKLKPINDKFGWFYGIGFGVSFNMNKTNSETLQNFTNRSQPNLRFESKINSEATMTSISPSLFAPVGVYYTLGKFFRVYAQVSPNLYFSHTINENFSKTNNIDYDNNQPVSTKYTGNSEGSGKQNNFGLNFSNWNSFFTVVYRWEK